MTDKELLRWALADQAFNEAEVLAKLVVEQKPKEGSPLFAACCNGIASCYCRPFMGSNGMGSLPQEFKDLMKFPDMPRLKKIHDMLWDTRVRFGGHFDRSYAEQLHERGELESSPSEVLVDLQTEGVNVSVNLVHMDAIAVDFSRKLFALQRARVYEQLSTYGEQLRKMNGGKLGKYYFRVASSGSAGDK